MGEVSHNALFFALGGGGGGGGEEALWVGSQLRSL